MTTATIGKWGNASAVRLPKPFCDLIGITIGDDVRLSVDGNQRIIIEPAYEEHTLKSRMRQWDGVRYHSEELDWGSPAGEELW